MDSRYDYVILGGGIVGISTASQLQQHYPQAKILVLEKEADVSMHQTGHNSGVIHAGVYYQPGSLKAQFCREGSKKTKAFCEKHQIPYDECGKLLVATNDIEAQRMQALHERCHKNQIEAHLLSEAELRQEEPNITGIGGIYVPSTAIVNYRQVTQKMAEEFTSAGGKLQLNTEVQGLQETEEDITLHCQNGSYQTRFLITCAGLMADRITRMLNIDIDFRIIPYRGEYYRLSDKYKQLVKHLIYPIPDPDLPFLGVHLTRMIDGSVTVGPNAVQGWKREGYGKINFSLHDTLDMLAFPGFWKVASKHLKTGLIETRNSWWKAGYLKMVQKYCPQLQVNDLQPYPAGIRAQAVMRDGSLVHDFLFAETPRSLHVCNAPSPAATSAIPIGNYICTKVAEKTGKAFADIA